MKPSTALQLHRDAVRGIVLRNGAANPRVFSKSRRLPDWVADIREATQNIESDIGKAGEAEFLADGKTLRADARSLCDLGEAANQIMRLAPHWEQSNPRAWEQLRRVYAMRNGLAHGYFRVDAGVVWATVKQDLPKRQSLLSALPGLASSE